MIFLDTIFYGWFLIFSHTIYATSNSRSVNSKEHSFFLAFLAHSINLWTIYSYVLVKCCNITTSLYPGLLISAVVFIAGYVGYFRSGRADTLIKQEAPPGRMILSIVSAISYVSVSAYLMIRIGDYIRSGHLRSALGYLCDLSIMIVSRN